MEMGSYVIVESVTVVVCYDRTNHSFPRVVFELALSDRVRRFEELKVRWKFQSTLSMAKKSKCKIEDNKPT